MSRPRIYEKAARTHLTLPENLKKQASRRAFELGYSGGLSELVARLLNAELSSNKSIAQRFRRLAMGGVK